MKQARANDCQPAAQRAGCVRRPSRLSQRAHPQSRLRDRYCSPLAEARSARTIRGAGGTLADFIEVSGEHEGIVDEFLREELNYVVVENWGAAEEGVRVLKTSDGRATFLVHSDAQGELFATGEGPINEPGVTPLRSAIKMLNGFGQLARSRAAQTQEQLSRQRTRSTLKRLALRYGHAYFLTPEGECFHRTTVTGGKPASEGPLALKRELRETESRLAKLESELIQAEDEAETLTRAIASLTAQLETPGEERRQSRERDRESWVQRSGKWRAKRSASNGDCKSGRSRRRATRMRAKRKRASNRGKREEAARLEGDHEQAESSLNAQQAQLESLRQNRETLQQEAAEMTAELAGLEERRRGAEAAFQRIDRLFADLERRMQSIEPATRVGERRSASNASTRIPPRWSSGRRKLIEIRASALATAQTIAEQAQALRLQLAELEAQLKTDRTALDQVREDRAALSSELAKLHADLAHLEASCLAEVNVEAHVLRADAEIARIWRRRA
jgi:chromosome segregation protein